MKRFRTHLAARRRHDHFIASRGPRAKPRRPAPKLLAALAVAAVVALGMLAGTMEGGKATPTAYAAPSTITGKADIVITNKQQAYYEGAVAQCKATIHLPDGSTQIAYGRCISGIHYAVPYDGTYDYVGTLQQDGTYSIVIHSNTSGGANADTFLEGEMWGTQQMGEIHLRYNPKATVRFTKTSADVEITKGNGTYSLKGAVYDIYRASDGAKVTSITTDEHGHASCELTPNTSYYAIEVKAPAGFSLNNQRVDFSTGDSEGSVPLSDKAGTVRLIIAKKDSATGGKAQVGASLEGAEFRVTSTSTSGWSATGTTNKEGSVVFDAVPLGNIVVTETKAPAGYKLDPNAHTYTVGADQLGDAEVITLEPDDFIEHVIAFDIDIVKYRDTGAEGSGLQHAGPGIRFEIISNTTGKTVGSLITDENGKASTDRAETVNREAIAADKTDDPQKPWMGEGKRVEGISGALPYDAKGYTVREDPSTTPEGYRPCPDWTIGVDAMADGASLHYIVDNDLITSRIQVVKADAESGQTVPLAGFSFQLLDKDLKPITQEVWYPNHSEVSIFETDETGTVTFPEALRSGTYYLREVAAREPYLLPNKDVKVVISDEHETGPVTVVRVADEQARGVASIHKTCSEKDDCPHLTEFQEPSKSLQTGKISSQSKYDAAYGLAGAEFDVVALDDVISPDGTIQATAGQIVDHVVTQEGGWAQSRELPLGMGGARYAFVETKAPDGHVLDATPLEFTLTYQDSSTNLVYADVEAANEPTHLEVDKNITGNGAPLEGASFSLWNRRDEISVSPNEGGAIAVRAPEGSTVCAQQRVPYAVIELVKPDAISVSLQREGSSPLELTTSQTNLEPGLYALSVIRDGKQLDIDLKELDIVENQRYVLSITQGVFGTSATLAHAGDACKPVELTYRKEDNAYTASDLSAGRYELTVDGGEAHTATLGTTASYAMFDSGTWTDLPILLTGGATTFDASTDASGTLTVKHLEEGAYGLRETGAPPGFIGPYLPIFFSVDAHGQIEGKQTHTVTVENDYTKVEISKRDITNEEEVEGAKLSILNNKGEVVEQWTSGSEAHRIDRLAPGTYTLVEDMTPRGYDKAKSVAFTVEETGAVQTVTMYDEPVTVQGEIDKRQEIADPTAPDTVENGDGLNQANVTVSPEGRFDYSIDFRNTSSTWVDEFTVTDDLDAVREGLAIFEGITTPVAREDFDGKLNVWYTTNNIDDDHMDESGANATRDDGHDNPWLTDPATVHLGDDGRAVSYAGWALWTQDLPADEAHMLFAKDLGLDEGEYITGIRLEYGRVEQSFTSRRDSWKRDDLKDPHDDLDRIERAQSSKSEGDNPAEQSLSPAVIHMRATGEYLAGTDLSNSAHVDLYRNGGGTGLEDHDEDYVTQTPGNEPKGPLAQTGWASPAAFLLAGALAAGGVGLACGRRARVRPQRPYLKRRS